MEDQDSDPYRTIVLVDEHPLCVREDWINIREDVAGISLAAFVVPFRKGTPAERHFKGIPIITWEEPTHDIGRAEQYCTLFRVTEAESLVVLGWRYLIMYANEQDHQFMVTVHHLLFPVMSGMTLSRLIHRKLHGHLKRGCDGEVL